MPSDKTPIRDLTANHVPLTKLANAFEVDSRLKDYPSDISRIVHRHIHKLHDNYTTLSSSYIYCEDQGLRIIGLVTHTTIASLFSRVASLLLDVRVPGLLCILSDFDHYRQCMIAHNNNLLYGDGGRKRGLR